MLVGMLIVLVLFSIPAATTQAEAARELLPWAGRIYVGFLVPLLAFLSAAGLVRDDLQAGSVDYLFTRPVRRPVFVILRYVAHVGCTQIDFLFGLAVIAGLGIFHQVPGLAEALPLLLLAQVVAIMAFSAFGFLCAMITSCYVIIGLLYGALIEVGLGNVPTQLSHLSMSRQVLTLLAPVLERSGGTSPMLVAAVSAPMAVGILIATAVVMLGVTAAIFHVREPAGSLGRE
jgi:ABC-2 type transport system permease protein